MRSNNVGNELTQSVEHDRPPQVNGPPMRRSLFLYMSREGKSCNAMTFAGDITFRQSASRHCEE
jgi:hypothetical protein